MGLAKSLDDTLSEDDTSNETPPVERPEELRLIEALLFAAGEPLDEKTLRSRLPEGIDIASAMRRLQAEYAPRGVNLVRIAGKWTFRTADRKSTRLNSSHVSISYAVFCLKKKKKKHIK